MKQNFSTKKLVIAAIMTALVVILQYLGSFIKFGAFSISLVQLPIVVGGALCGRKIGAWLGLVFGTMVLISGDAALFLGVNVAGTILTVLIKGILCGYFAGLVFELLSKKNQYLGVAASALTCSVVNTGIFLIGCIIFFMDKITEMATVAGLGENVGQFMLVGLVGTNFLIEIGVSIILCPVIVRLLGIRKN